MESRSDGQWKGGVMANGKEERWPMERRSDGQWKGGVVANGKKEWWPMERRSGGQWKGGAMANCEAGRCSLTTSMKKPPSGLWCDASSRSSCAQHSVSVGYVWYGCNACAAASSRSRWVLLQGAGLHAGSTPRASGGAEWAPGGGERESRTAVHAGPPQPLLNPC